MKKNKIYKLLEGAKLPTPPSAGNENSGLKQYGDALKLQNKNPGNTRYQQYAIEAEKNYKNIKWKRDKAERDAIVAKAANAYNGTSEEDQLKEASDYILERVDNAYQAAKERRGKQLSDSLKRLQQTEKLHDATYEKKVQSIKKQIDANNNSIEISKETEEAAEESPTETNESSSLVDEKKEKEEIELLEPLADSKPENLTDDEKKK